MADAMDNTTRVQVSGEPEDKKEAFKNQLEEVFRRERKTLGACGGPLGACGGPLGASGGLLGASGGPLLKLKLGKNGRVPKRGSEMAVGFDLYASETVTIKGYSAGEVFHDFKMFLDSTNIFAELQGRSSTYKKGLLVIPGVIDNDYRGEIKTIVFNLGEEEYTIKKNESISQFVFKNYNTEFNVQILGDDEELPFSKRGENGFGSTDKAGEDGEDKDVTSTIDSDSVTSDSDSDSLDSDSSDLDTDSDVDKAAKAFAMMIKRARESKHPRSRARQKLKLFNRTISSFLQHIDDDDRKKNAKSRSKKKT